MRRKKIKKDKDVNQEKEEEKQEETGHLVNTYAVS